jgi:hypothetical protein
MSVAGTTFDYGGWLSGQGLAGLGASPMVIPLGSGLRQVSVVATNRGMPSYSISQLQHEFKHASDFGVTGNWNKANGEAFQAAINNHVSDPVTAVIQGTYRGQSATHYFNPATGNNVFVKPDGSFWGAWKLGQDQIKNITSHGGLQ